MHIDDPAVPMFVRNSRLVQTLLAQRKTACDATSKHFAAEHLRIPYGQVPDGTAIIDFLIHRNDPIPKKMTE